MTLPSFLFRCRGVRLVLILAFCFRNSAAGQTPASAPSATANATYTINLSPPNQVGQKFGLVTDVSQKMRMQVDAHLIGISALNKEFNQETATHFEAEGEVLAVFPNGGIKKVALTVTSLQSVSDSDNPAGLPAPGAKIVAEAPDKAETPVAPTASKTIRGDKGRTTVVAATPEPTPEPKPTITIDGVPATDDVARLLEDVLPLDDGKPTVQEIFGPTKPVAVGATWPVKTELFFEEMNHGKGDASSSKGATSLDRVEGEGDGRVVTVSGNFSGSGIKPPLPLGVPVDSIAASFVRSMIRSVPATRTMGVEKRTTTTAIKFMVHMSKILVMSANINGTMQLKTFSEITYDAVRANPAPDLELDPDNALAYVSRAEAKQYKGDFDGAIADFNRALAIDPKNFYTHAYRAWDEITKGDFKEAVADYGQVLDLDPKNAESYRRRGYAREMDGSFEDALADYKQAIELEPGDSIYPRLHGLLLLRRLGRLPGDFSKADAVGKDDWEKSIVQFVTGGLDETALLAAAGKPGDEPVKGQQCEAYYFIGMMRLLKGDLAGARDFFQKSLATDLKDYYEYQFARAELARMDLPK